MGPKFRFTYDLENRETRVTIVYNITGAFYFEIDVADYSFTDKTVLLLHVLLQTDRLLGRHILETIHFKDW